MDNLEIWSSPMGNSRALISSLMKTMMQKYATFGISDAFTNWVQITVINHMSQNVTVHWHGVEYAAYFCQRFFWNNIDVYSDKRVPRGPMVCLGYHKPQSTLVIVLFTGSRLLLQGPIGKKWLTLSPLPLMLIESRYHSHSRLSLLDGLYGALFIR